MTRVFILGAGRCGRALGRALLEAGHTVVGSTTRHPADLPWPNQVGEPEPSAFASAEVVWYTVPDDALSGLGASALPHQVALHASGAVPAESLRATQPDARSVAACHPLQSYPHTELGAEHSRGIAFGLQGEPAAVALGRELVTSMGSRPFVVADAESKALYHAACCVASNALVALADRAVTLFAGAGVPRAEALAALAPLIAGTAENLGRAHEARDVLTGPIARGDHETIARHEAAIAARLPAESANYRAICDEIERLLPGAADKTG